MTNQPKSFWVSIQGVFTGFAAVITALTGLYIAINSGSDQKPSDKLPTKAEIQTNETTQETPAQRKERLDAIRMARRDSLLLKIANKNINCEIEHVEEEGNCRLGRWVPAKLT